MEIRQTNARRMKSVQMRGLDDRIAVSRHLAVSLVIRHDQNDIRRTRGPTFRNSRREVGRHHRRQHVQRENE